MKSSAMNRLATLLLSTTLLALTACSNQGTLGTTDEAGMVTVEHGSFKELTLRSGVNFSDYSQVKIEPLNVSYSDERRQDRLNRPDEDFQFDERELAQFNKQFVKALSKQWQEQFGWQPTDTAGPGVVVVKAAVTDLYLYASIKNDALQPTRTATNESSRMDIKLDLVDAVSGELLLHSVGHKRTGQPGTGVETMTPMNSVTYWSDAYQAFRQWASLLATQMKLAG